MGSTKDDESPFTYQDGGGLLALDAEEQEEIAPKLKLHMSYLLWAYPSCFGFLASLHILRVGPYSVPADFDYASPAFALLGIVYLCMLAHRVYWVKRFYGYETEFNRRRNAFVRDFCSSDINKVSDSTRDEWLQTEEWFRKMNPTEDTLQLTLSPLIICSILVYALL